MPRIFVALGSNVEPERHLALAAGALARRFDDLRCSPWYRNRPRDAAGADFINFAAGFTSELSVHQIRAALRSIEAHCGRSREVDSSARSMPPVVDIDLLLYGDLVCREPSFELPRPELLERAYMLGPLADLAPELVHPVAGLTIGELWRRFDRESHPLERLDVG